MLEVNFEGIRYHRALVENATPDITQAFKDKFDYSFVISYGDFQDLTYCLVNKNACLIDLTNELETIFENFNATCRKQVRPTFRNPELLFFEDFGDKTAF